MPGNRRTRARHLCQVLGVRISKEAYVPLGGVVDVVVGEKHLVKSQGCVCVLLRTFCKGRISGRGWRGKKANLGRPHSGVRRANLSMLCCSNPINMYIRNLATPRGWVVEESPSRSSLPPSKDVIALYNKSTSRLPNVWGTLKW